VTTVTDIENYFSPMLKFYGYKKCSTCRKAEKALEAAGVPYGFADITETPPNKSELKKILDQSGLPIRKLFNTSGEQYKLLGIKDQIGSMTDAAALDLLAGNGRLIKRPLVTDGKTATVGFDESAFTKAWKKGR
jgi:arsenate reductase